MVAGVIDMNRLFNTALGVAMGLALSVAAQAQSHFRRGGGFHVSSPGSVRMVHAGQVQNTVLSTGNGVVVVGNPGLIPFSFGSFPVPGFGFDFTHFAAVNRNFAIQALIDPVTRQTLALERRLTTPIVPFVPFFTSSEPTIVIQQPPVIVLQQPPAQQEFVEPVARTRSLEPRDNVEPARAPEPAREVGDFVLVRRNGTVVFAVAFSTTDDVLTYITREGNRRSFPLAELDIDGTRRMNEERGISLRIPS